MWGAYPLGDLDEPWFSRSRWFLSDPEAATLLLLYEPTHGACVITAGAAAGAADLVRAAPLPARFDVHYPDAHAAPLAGLLEGELIPHLRLGLERGDLRVPSRPAGVEVDLLAPAEADAAQALYDAHYPGNWFDRSRIAEGAYLALRRGGRLVALAGTHVLARGTRVAALGDIVTDAAERGAGLGSFITGALCERLFAEVDLVVLNVASENAAARRAYARVGFGSPRPHLEGHAMRRVG